MGFFSGVLPRIPHEISSGILFKFSFWILLRTFFRNFYRGLSPDAGVQSTSRDSYRDSSVNLPSWDSFRVISRDSFQDFSSDSFPEFLHGFFEVLPRVWSRVSSKQNSPDSPGVSPRFPQWNPSGIAPKMYSYQNFFRDSSRIFSHGITHPNTQGIPWSIFFLNITKSFVSNSYRDLFKDSPEISPGTRFGNFFQNFRNFFFRFFFMMPSKTFLLVLLGIL